MVLKIIHWDRKGFKCQCVKLLVLIKIDLSINFQEFLPKFVKILFQHGCRIIEVNKLKTQILIFILIFKGTFLLVNLIESNDVETMETVKNAIMDTLISQRAEIMKTPGGKILISKTLETDTKMEMWYSYYRLSMIFFANDRLTESEFDYSRFW